MKKKVLSLALALVMLLALLPTRALGAVTYDPTTTPILDLLPTDLRRPVRPANVEQTSYAYTENKESNERAFQEIAALTDSLTAGKTGDREKMKAIYDWVSQNITYDKDMEDTTLAAHYTQRRGACGFYSGLCRLMGTMAGLTVADISGISNESSMDLHAWNAVLLDGEWLFFDATWKMWDMDKDYHHWFGALIYDDIYEWDIRAGSREYDDLLIFTPRRGLEDRCPAHLIVPDTVTEVTNFYGCPDLERITLADTVTSISGCGQNPKLKNVTFGKGITQIGNSAFLGCTGLKSVTIPASVTAIDHLAFSGTALESVTVPGSVTKVGSAAFYACADLKTVTLGSGVTTIGDSAFMECTALRSVTIPDSVTAIEGQAFMDCYSLALADLHIPAGVTQIGSLAFFGCPQTVGVPAGATAIEDEAFYGRKELTTMDIPEGVTSIGTRAFNSCHGLKRVTIPNSVTTIGNSAFCDCISLERVTVPDSVTTMGTGAFAGCVGLTNITLSNSITTIEDSMFDGCTGLTGVTIPNGVTSIKRLAFRGCTGLKSVTIPAGVTSIGKYAFDRCTGLTDVYYGGTEAQWKAISIQQYNTALTSATIHYNSAAPKPDETKITADPTNDALKVDGVSRIPTAYKIGGANYFQLRDVAMLLSGTKAQFSVDYDEARKAVVITTGSAYAPQGWELAGAAQSSVEAILGNNDIYINGEKTDFAVYKIDGANFFQIRALGQALGFNVGWTAQQGMFIESDKPYDPND